MISSLQPILHPVLLFALPFALPVLLASMLPAAPAIAQTSPTGPPPVTPGKQRVNPPPSAHLNYAVKSKQRGLRLEGSATVQWNVAGKRFSVATESQAMLLGKILEAKTEGVIDEYGLAPLVFTEKRFRKEATTVTFDRKTNTIHFAKNGEPQAIRGGEQDRNSAIWQLISLARAAPAKAKPGFEWRMVVAGPKDADPWTFRVIKHETIRIKNGEVKAVHIARIPPGDRDEKLDIWLDPAQEWYPVRLRFTEEDGDYIEQTLVETSKKPS